MLIILGIGTDIIEIDRIKTAVLKNSFLLKYFTDKEISLFSSKNNKPNIIAANFAAKEAFVKAIGTGFGNIKASQIEVLREVSGKPYINIFENAKDKCEILGVKNINISISHCQNYAVAFVVLEGAD